MLAVNLSIRLDVLALVSLYLTNKLISHGPFFNREVLRSPALMKISYLSLTTFGISDRFQSLFQSYRQVTHVLLTLPPLNGVAPIPFDLHASSTPSAFNLNQDQILKNKKLLKTWF